MKHGAKQSTTLVDSTGKSVEVIELIVDYARVGTVVVRVCRASSTGWRTGDDVVAETVEEHRGPATGDVLSPGPIQFFLEHGASLEEVHVVVLSMFPCELKRGEVAQKTEVAGAASVNSNDRTKDTPIVAVLVKFAFNWSLLVRMGAVDDVVEPFCLLEVG